MNIHPIGRRVYFEPEISKSFLVSDDEKRKEKGKVIAVGKDVQEVKVGDLIIYAPWAVDKYQDETGVYYFIVEDDNILLAKIND